GLFERAPARAKRRVHPWTRPLRGLSTPTHRRTGAPGKAAGHPGPHFQKKPEQSHSTARGLSCSFARARVAEPIAERPLATRSGHSRHCSLCPKLRPPGAMSLTSKRLVLKHVLRCLRGLF